jgi:hypothetical protein
MTPNEELQGTAPGVLSVLAGAKWARGKSMARIHRRVSLDTLPGAR